MDPRYVMQLKDIMNFYHSENVDTKTIVQKMILKFYDYIMTT